MLRECALGLRSEEGDKRGGVGVKSHRLPAAEKVMEVRHESL